MSRAGLPIHSSTCTDPWPATLGIFAAEGGHKVEANGSMLESRHLTVVLNFESLTRQRTLMCLLVGAMRFVIERHQFVPLADAMAQLTRFFSAYERASVNVIVLLPDATSMSMVLVDEALATMGNIPALCIESVVGVAEAPHDWSALCGVRYFVDAGISGVHWAALSIYRIFAAVMAPEAILEVDTSDIQSCLGTASDPSFLLHAEWDPGARQLRLFADCDESDIGRVAASLLTTLTVNATPTFARDVMRQWAAICPPDALVAGSITVGFFEPSWRAEENAQRVVALCR